LNKNKCCIILTTTSDHDIAEIISQSLIKSSLAACVQVDQVTSYFKYQDKLTKAAEYRLTIKCACSNYDNIVQLIQRKHNYQLPQIIKLDINSGTPQYIEWLLGATKPGNNL